MTQPATVAAGQARALATASWTDTFTVTGSPQQFGKAGEFTLFILIDGNLVLASEPPQSSVYLRVFIRFSDSYGADSRLVGGMQIKRMNDGSVQTLPMDGALIGPGTWSLRVKFHFSRTTYIMASAEVLADARASAVTVAEGVKRGEATADFGHTLEWAGLHDLRDEGGSPVPNFTVNSDSGYDYVAGSVSPKPVITPSVSGSRTPTGWRAVGPRHWSLMRRLA
jgi:hypothetical protein